MASFIARFSEPNNGFCEPSTCQVPSINGYSNKFPTVEEVSKTVPSTSAKRIRISEEIQPLQEMLLRKKMLKMGLLARKLLSSIFDIYAILIA